MLKLNGEHHDAAESVWNPRLAGYECDGVHRLVYAAVMRCPMDYRGNLFRHLLLVGGTTCLAGFPERLQEELRGGGELLVRHRTCSVVLVPCSTHCFLAGNEGPCTGPEQPQVSNLGRCISLCIEQKW
jgi:hypothetical protein